MATRYGHATLKWLEERGWKAAPIERKFVCGDQQVIDPQTNKKTSVYEAARLQKTRTGEYPNFLPKED